MSFLLFKCVFYIIKYSNLTDQQWLKQVIIEVGNNKSILSSDKFIKCIDCSGELEGSYIISMRFHTITLCKLLKDYI